MTHTVIVIYAHSSLFIHKIVLLTDKKLDSLNVSHLF